MTESYSGADITAICKEAVDIPLGEALRGGTAREIEERDFVKVLEGRKPSILSWYVEARREVKKRGVLMLDEAMAVFTDEVEYFTVSDIAEKFGFNNHGAELFLVDLQKKGLIVDVGLDSVKYTKKRSAFS